MFKKLNVGSDPLEPQCFIDVDCGSRDLSCLLIDICTSESPCTIIDL